MAAQSFSHLDTPLEILHELGLVSHLDYYFALNMAQVYTDASSLAALTCALVSRALSQGHICLDLEEMANTILVPGGQGQNSIALPDLDSWCDHLNTQDMVGKAIQSEKQHPLILDRDNNLYLSKYHDFQNRLVHNIAHRLSHRLSIATSPMDGAFIKEGLDRFFAGQDPAHIAGQKEAVQKALTHNFLVISGGPGTGKTHITSIIRRLLEEWARQNQDPVPKIISVAPTGKAASRMEQGATIHSLLKPQKKGVGFRHNRDNPLSADMVIIDEASMIDIALMTRLLEAIPMDAKVIMLGDKNQLSPVQAGAVFTDICGVSQMSAFQVFLDFNFRSKGQGGIENLAKAINQKDTKTLTSMLTQGTFPEVGFENTGNKSDLVSILKRYVGEEYRGLAESQTPEQALDQLDSFRVLCAHNKGDTGTLQINHLCENILRSKGEFDIKRSVFKRIVMVSRNDYQKGLFNGDTGIVYAQNNGIRTCFRSPEGQINDYRYLDIPMHETAFAVTIHKSQGSEYDTVLILIPGQLSPVVTRQLLYTGVTRARKKAIIVGSFDLICQAMESTLNHRSNVTALLAERLGMDVDPRHPDQKNDPAHGPGKHGLKEKI